MFFSNISVAKPDWYLGSCIRWSWLIFTDFAVLWKFFLCNTIACYAHRKTHFRDKAFWYQNFWLYYLPRFRHLLSRKRIQRSQIFPHPKSLCPITYILTCTGSIVSNIIIFLICWSFTCTSSAYHLVDIKLFYRMGICFDKVYLFKTRIDLRRLWYEVISCWRGSTGFAVLTLCDTHICVSLAEYLAIEQHLFSEFLGINAVRLLSCTILALNFWMWYQTISNGKLIIGLSLEMEILSTGLHSIVLFSFLLYWTLVVPWRKNKITLIFNVSSGCWISSAQPWNSERLTKSSSAFIIYCEIFDSSEFDSRDNTSDLTWLFNRSSKNHFFLFISFYWPFIHFYDLFVVKYFLNAIIFVGERLKLGGSQKLLRSLKMCHWAFLELWDSLVFRFVEWNRFMPRFYWLTNYFSTLWTASINRDSMFGLLFTYYAILL